LGLETTCIRQLERMLVQISYKTYNHNAADQWRRKIVEFRGAEAEGACSASMFFSPANIELFIATNSPDDSLLLSWVHSDSLPSDSDKLPTSLLSILHLFASLTRKERCNRYL